MSFVKSIIRIAVPIVVSLIPGAQPLAIALSAAAATAATGGSFKESLLSGATSFIGSSISRSVSSSIQGAATSSIIDEGAFEAAISAGIPVTQAGGGTIPTALSSLAAQASAPIASLSTTPGGTDLFSNIVSSGGDALQTFQGLADKTLGSLGINTTDLFLDPALAGTGLSLSGADLIGGAVGGVATLTLNQALNAEIPGLDDALINAGFTPQAVASLRDEARKRLAQEKFDEILGATTAPAGLSDEDFNKIIASGVERLNVGLGETTTAAAFQAAFGESPETLGAGFLQEETGLRREAFSQQIGELFNPLTIQPEFDDDIISSILDTEIGRVESGIAISEARGNLNKFGGRTAREFIEGQRSEGEELFQDVGNIFRQDLLRGVGTERAGAERVAQSFELGQSDPDFTPFVSRAQDLIGTSVEPSSLERSLRDIAGPLNIFDLRGAINKGGASQGLVPGPAQSNLLDAFTSRAAPDPRRTRRGLGTQGAF